MVVRHVPWEEVESQSARNIRFPMSGWWIIAASGQRVSGPFETRGSAEQHLAMLGDGE